MGTLYGESAGTWHPQYLHHNDQLLRAVAMQVCLYSTGLRVVAGDFNLKEHDVAAFQILESAGFRDIQSIACDRWVIRSRTPASAPQGLISQRPASC
jgi:hypothetical protein